MGHSSEMDGTGLLFLEQTFAVRSQTSDSCPARRGVSIRIRIERDDATGGHHICERLVGSSDILAGRGERGDLSDARRKCKGEY